MPDSIRPCDLTFAVTGSIAELVANGPIRPFAIVGDEGRETGVIQVSAWMGFLSAMEYTSFSGEAPTEYPPVEELSQAPAQGPLTAYERRIESPCAASIKHAIEIGTTRPPVKPKEGDETLQAVIEGLRTMLLEDAKTAHKKRGNWTQGLLRTVTDDGRLGGEFGLAVEEAARCWDDLAEAEGAMDSRSLAIRAWLRSKGLMPSRDIPRR